jgi:hypothetical protein
MYGCTKQLKGKVVIRNEIMIHFDFPKSISNSQKPYSNDVWIEKKLKHKFNKNFFSILNFELNDKFYTKEMRLNPSNETLFAGFKIALKRWIKGIIPKGIAIKFIFLDTRYMYDMVNDMVELLDVINKTNSTSFLQDDGTSIFTIVSTTHIIK